MIISCGAALFATLSQEDKINFNPLNYWKQKFNENVFSRKEQDDLETKEKKEKTVTQEKKEEALRVMQEKIRKR